MHEFRVWAPGKGSVDVVTGGREVPMRPRSGGWWASSVNGAGPGTDYSFRVDGGPARPDPRSPFQPEGIDGPSRVVDHGAFAWTDGRWRGLPLAGSVLYECHVGTFSAEGTFDGAIGHLGHLVSLGVDAIELLPVAEFSGPRGWGYDGVDLFAPHHAYGGPDGLKRLVDVVGPSFAKEIFYTARQFTAEEALGMGLVNRIVADGELESYVNNYCTTIAGNAPLTVRAAKQIVREALKDESKRDMALCKRVVEECFASEDYTEGRTAFMEKRRPVFKGR